MTDGVWSQALRLLADGVVADVNRCNDECGVPSLVRLDMVNGDYMIVGEEDDAGYTFTIYDADGAYFHTDGDPDIAGFSADVRRLYKK